jgi:hypothetical protein
MGYLWLFFFILTTCGYRFVVNICTWIVNKLCTKPHAEFAHLLITCRNCSVRYAVPNCSRWSYGSVQFVFKVGWTVVPFRAWCWPLGALRFWEGRPVSKNVCYCGAVLLSVCIQEGCTSMDKKELHGLSRRANYTDRATAACRRSDCQLLRIEGCHVVSVTDPYGRILGFIDRSRYFSIK